MKCVVTCRSTSFPWLVFFFEALLWGSMIYKHTGRWMWQGSASVVSWNREKYSCHSKLVSILSVLLTSGEYPRFGTLISYSWAQVLEACDCLKLLSIYFNLCVNACGVVISLVFLAQISMSEAHMHTQTHTHTHKHTHQNTQTRTHPNTHTGALKHVQNCTPWRMKYKRRFHLFVTLIHLTSKIHWICVYFVKHGM